MAYMQQSCIYLTRILTVLMIATLASICRAQESPYFVTYDHHLEEPGNLEIETSSTAGVPRSGQTAFIAPWVELEYGVTGRWTSEFYLEGESTRGDRTIFTGWRIENRFCPLQREHWINPVLYLEYENLNEGSRIQKEVVGNAQGFDEPNAVLRRTPAHELETKLILSGGVHDWNVAGNFTVEKNLSHNEGFEFGYSIGVSRPLGLLASAEDCHFCPENFAAGLEIYGGLGSTRGLGLPDTAHYLAPVIGWQLSDNSSLRFSPGIGLTHESNPVLLRIGYSYELRGFGTRMQRLFRGRQ